jgi:hypothetical protein
MKSGSGLVKSPHPITTSTGTFELKRRYLIKLLDFTDVL